MIRRFCRPIIGGMNTNPTASPASTLSPLELKRKITTKAAADLNGVSEDFFKRNYKHLIRKIGPRRNAVELGDAINLPPKPT